MKRAFVCISRHRVCDDNDRVDKFERLPHVLHNYSSLKLDC
jgi:hypothetical protein